MPVKRISLEGLPPFEIEVHAANDQYVAADILEQGVWEPFETEIIRRCLTSRSDFYDVGANIGWYSVLAGLELARTGGAVHAFEPVRENVQLLTRNIMAAHLSNVRINPCALGRAIEAIDLHLSPDNKGDHRVYPCEVGRYIERGSMTRFDHYFRSSHRQPLVKVDTQGFELSVLEGMGDYLFSEQGMVLLIEFWPHGLNQETDNVSKLLQLLSGGGFKPFTVVEGDHFIRPTAWDRLASSAKTTLAPETGRFVNLLLHREGAGVEYNLADLINPEPSPLVPA